MNDCGNNGGCGTHDIEEKVPDSARDDNMEGVCKLGSGYGPSMWGRGPPGITKPMCGRK